MRRTYYTPEIHCQALHLGVFGDYGSGGGDGGSDTGGDISPIKVIERLQMRMD